MEQSVEVNQQKRDIVTEDKNKADNADSKDQKEEEQIPPKKLHRTLQEVHQMREQHVITVHVIKKISSLTEKRLK